MRMKRKRRKRRDTIDRIELSREMTKFRSEFQYLSNTQSLTAKNKYYIVSFFTEHLISTISNESVAFNISFERQLKSVVFSTWITLDSIAFRTLLQEDLRSNSISKSLGVSVLVMTWQMISGHCEYFLQTSHQNLPSARHWTY